MPPSGADKLFVFVMQDAPVSRKSSPSIGALDDGEGIHAVLEGHGGFISYGLE